MSKAGGSSADVEKESRKRPVSLRLGYLRLAFSATVFASRHLRPGEQDFCMNSIRALIVDDSSVMRKIVERSLRQAGIDLKQAVEAGNGAEALAALTENPVDIILCDINMPIMDGLEFVKQLSGVANAKGVPVVMITTEGSEAQVVQAISAGARGYIRKPFTADQVRDQIIPILAGKS
jgi:two-component system chemotaxis response regulator CheY